MNMLTDEQRIALLPKVIQKGKEPVTQVWLTQGDALSYSERIEAAATEPLLQRIAELEQRNSDLHEDVQRFKQHALNEKAARKEAESYRQLRNGSNWPAAFASQDAPEPLRGEELGAAMQKGQS